MSIAASLRSSLGEERKRDIQPVRVGSEHRRIEHTVGDDSVGLAGHQSHREGGDDIAGAGARAGGYADNELYVGRYVKVLRSCAEREVVLEQGVVDVDVYHSSARIGRVMDHLEAGRRQCRELYDRAVRQGREEPEGRSALVVGGCEEPAGEHDCRSTGQAGEIGLERGNYRRVVVTGCHIEDVTCRRYRNITGHVAVGRVIDQSRHAAGDHVYRRSVGRSVKREELDHRHVHRRFSALQPWRRA